MDIVTLVKSQMLASLFSAFDSAEKTLVPAGETRKGEIVRAPDKNGTIAVRLAGGTISLATTAAQDPALRGRLHLGMAVHITNSDDGKTLALRLIAAEPPAGQPVRTTQALATLLQQPETQPLLSRTAVPPPKAILQHMTVPSPVASLPAMQIATPEISTAIFRQESLATSLTTLAALADNPATPPIIKSMIVRILGGRLDASQPITAKALQDAIQTAIAGPAQPVSSHHSATEPDLKSLLAALKTVAQTFLDAPESRRLTDQLDNRDMPPRRDGTTQAQAVPTSLQDSRSTQDPRSVQEIVAQVVRHAEAGEARLLLTHALHRVETGSDARPDRRADLRLVLAAELPIALGQQTAIADMRFEQQGCSNGEHSGKLWQARFSVDAPETGPIHARAGLMGDVFAATLWVENPDTARAMRAELATLQESLANTGLNVRELRIIEGRAPAQPKGAQPNHLVGVA